MERVYPRIVESKSELKQIDNDYLRILKENRGSDQTPKFEFYLYNDAGTIIKQYLSIHEIQQILLQQSQTLGTNEFF